MKNPILFATIMAALILSAQAAHAGDDGQTQIRPYVNKHGASMFVAWDTKTGNSKIYYWDSKVAKYATTEIGLPASPLGKATGSIMIEPYVNGHGASMFVVWDTKTGDSKIFYWDSKVAKYVATEIGLPENPLGKVAGSIMIEPYVNGHGASMFVVFDTKTGNSKIYYWDSKVAKYVATEVGLPKAPLK